MGRIELTADLLLFTLATWLAVVFLVRRAAKFRRARRVRRIKNVIEFPERTALE